MFCQNCGAEVEGVKFCPKCGTKLENDTEQSGGQQPVNGAGQPAAQQPVYGAEQPVQKRKKKRIWIPILIGLFGLIMVALVVGIFAYFSSYDPIDYVATVKAYTPFKDSQGLDYTMEEVLEEYFEDLLWTDRKKDDAHYENITGSIRTGKDDLELIVRIESDPDDSERVSFEFDSFTLGDYHTSRDNDITLALLNLFSMYDEGYSAEEVAEAMEAETEDTEAADAAAEEADTTGPYVPGLVFEGLAVSDLMKESGEEILQKLPGYTENVEDIDLGFYSGDRGYCMMEGDRLGFLYSFCPEDFLINGSALPVDDTGSLTADAVTGMLGGDYVATWNENGDDVMIYTYSDCYLSFVIDDSLSEVYLITLTNAYVMEDPCYGPLQTAEDFYAPGPEISYEGTDIEALFNTGMSDLIDALGEGYTIGDDGGVYYDDVGLYSVDGANLAFLYCHYPEELVINGYTLQADETGALTEDSIVSLLGYAADSGVDEEGYYYMTYIYPNWYLYFNFNKMYEVDGVMIGDADSVNEMLNQ